MREVLRLLLRDQGPEIRGHMRPYSELLEASGYGDQPDQFEDLMRILDTELRLITPTDPSGDQTEQRATRIERHYQLTHDYLVPALREWLAAKQKESRRGRAELRLAERALLWDNRREARQLPSLAEWLAISMYTGQARWSARERAMMSSATRHHLARGILALLAAVLLLVGAAWGYQEFQARALVERLRAAKIAHVPAIIRELDPFRRWAAPALDAMASDSARPRPERLHASLALVRWDRASAQSLITPLLEGDPDEVRVIGEELRSHRGDVLDPLWRAARIRRRSRAVAFGQPARWPGSIRPRRYGATSRVRLSMRCWPRTGSSLLNGSSSSAPRGVRSFRH